jgi:hypothetical protein
MKALERLGLIDHGYDLDRLRGAWPGGPARPSVGPVDTRPHENRDHQNGPEQGNPTSGAGHRIHRPPVVRARRRNFTHSYPLSRNVTTE